MYDAAKFEAFFQKLEADPEAFHRTVIDDLIKEKGADWVKEHASELEANWGFAKLIMGL